MRDYITLNGRSVWGQLNAYNEVLRENQYLPDMIRVFTEEAFRKNVEIIKEGMVILSEEYGCDPTITAETVPDGDLMGAGKKISALVIGEYGGKRERDEVGVVLGGARAERFRRDLVTSRRLMKLKRG